VIEEGTTNAGVLVPQQAVTRDPRGGATAMVVNGDDTIELRQLQAPRAVGDRWLVTEGLAPGDRVVVEGLQKIRPGTSVRVTTFDAVARSAAPEVP
jgi:membrane fusion protein (multidrug efflux system)